MSAAITIIVLILAIYMPFSIALDWHRRSRLEIGRRRMSESVLSLEKIMLSAGYCNGDIMHDKVFVFMQKAEMGAAQNPAQVVITDHWDSYEMRTVLHKEIARHAITGGILENFIDGYFKVARYRQSPILNTAFLRETLHNSRDIINAFKRFVLQSKDPFLNRIYVFEDAYKQILKESFAARAMLSNGLSENDILNMFHDRAT